MQDDRALPILPKTSPGCNPVAARLLGFARSWCALVDPLPTAELHIWHDHCLKSHARVLNAPFGFHGGRFANYAEKGGKRQGQEKQGVLWIKTDNT